MYHGQYKTDKYLSEYFEPGFVGLAIDVGAARPKRNSNTYYFEQQGWTVYCIEPNPAYLPDLQAQRQHVFHFACGRQDLPTANFVICTLDSGNQEAVSALQVDGRLLTKHLPYHPSLQTIQVPVRSLNSFLAEHQVNSIDLLSIDTEGTEMDVLRGLDLHKFAPKLIVVENNWKDGTIEKYLSNFGYHKDKRVVINDIFLKS